VREQLDALSARASLLAVEKDTQEICQSIVDMRGVLDDLVTAMLNAGLPKDDEANDAMGARNTAEGPQGP
jgi:hypothetical protein